MFASVSDELLKTSFLNFKNFSSFRFLSGLCCRSVNFTSRFFGGQTSMDVRSLRSGQRRFHFKVSWLASICFFLFKLFQTFSKYVDATDRCKRDIKMKPTVFFSKMCLHKRNRTQKGVFYNNMIKKLNIFRGKHPIPSPYMPICNYDSRSVSVCFKFK